jgi:hypothetical protein
MKTILASISLIALLTPTEVSAQETTYTTQFSLTSRVGSITSEYSLTDRRRVVLPNGVNWTCSSVPVSVSSDGSYYMAGFLCTNAADDIIVLQAQCFTGRVDYERHVVSLTNADPDVGTVRLQAECRTAANEQTNPFSNPRRS